MYFNNTTFSFCYNGVTRILTINKFLFTQRSRNASQKLPNISGHQTQETSKCDDYCLFCGVTLKTIEDVLKHNEEKHTYINVMANFTRKVKNYVCGYCQQKLYNKESLIFHMATNHDDSSDEEKENVPAGNCTFNF